MSFLIPEIAYCGVLVREDQKRETGSIESDVDLRVDLEVSGQNR